MNNNDIIQGPDELQGKKSSLWHLTKENAIVIPIIQRDYAQGRTNDEVRQIREPFLKKIFKVLDDSDEKLELDFIYGSLEKPKDISLKNVDYEIFVPLDGQQRLTTLFLLHWFLALWNEDDFDLMREHFKGRFAYVTRLSSSEFCSELLEHVCSQDVVCSILNDAQKKPVSRILKNEGWFHNQWENDPTISGMLTMLDTMAFLFCDTFKNGDKQEKARHFFKRLACDNVEESAITFNLLYLNRGDFHLSDELYIKMNSRGKPLSDFEAFKARFESFIEKHTKVGSDFASNIDGKWADVFWNMRNNVRPTSEDAKNGFYRDNTDGMMMNVIKVVLANQFAILAEDNDNGLDELFESQVAKKTNPEMHLTFYRYTELGVFNEMGEDDYDYDEVTGYNETICQSVYDTFSFIYDIKKHDEKYNFDPKFMDVDEQLNNILFYGIDGRNSKITSITYQTRLMFWALSAYCIRYRDEIQNCEEERYLPLNRWVRFVRNIVEATEINKVSDMQKALKFLNSVFVKMSDGDIVNYLSKIEGAPECTPFPQSQIKEEILKAQLISCDSTWEEPITNADNVSFWPGRSGYLLYFSKISDISYQEICQWNSATHKSYQDKYNTYKLKMDMLLSYLGGTDFQTDCLLERAMLSKGNYFRKEGKESIIYSMMDQSINSRSYSFRQMVQFNGINCKDDDTIYKDGVECLKAVLDDCRYCYSNNDDVEKSLQNIVNESSKQIHNWKQPLLCDPRIWHEARQRFVWIDEETAWVVRQKGGATNQYETWSYYLFLLLEKEGLRFEYYPHSSPRFTFLNFKVGNQMYRLSIGHKSSGDWQFKMEAINENYQPIGELNSEMHKVISEMMPGHKDDFIKESIEDVILCAKDMQQRIESNYELL